MVIGWSCGWIVAIYDSKYTQFNLLSFLWFSLVRVAYHIYSYAHRSLMIFSRMQIQLAKRELYNEMQNTIRWKAHLCAKYNKICNMQIKTKYLINLMFNDHIFRVKIHNNRRMKIMHTHIRKQNAVQVSMRLWENIAMFIQSLIYACRKKRMEKKYRKKINLILCKSKQFPFWARKKS